MNILSKFQLPSSSGLGLSVLGRYFDSRIIYSICVYKSNIITQAWVYLIINLDKLRFFFLGISNMIYDCPSEMVAEHFFGLHVVVSYIYKAVRHILESVCFCFVCSLLKIKFL